MAMDAISATMANGRQAIVDIDKESNKNKFIPVILIFIIEPFEGGLGQILP
jgi:hypothetical protein